MWNYQDFYSGATFTDGKNSITSGAYLQITANFNYLYSDANGLKFASLKTMIHEMWHIFGLKDLYRSETNSRVYYMSAISNAISPIPMSVEIMKTVGKQKDHPLKNNRRLTKSRPLTTVAVQVSRSAVNQALVRITV